MRSLLLVAAMAAFATACTVSPKSPGGSSAITLAGSFDRRPEGTAGLFLAQEAAAPAPPPEKRLCDAPSLAYLVGHKRTDIPVPADLSRRRVACTTCPGSEDHQPLRTDILFDARTGLVTAVTCG